MCSRRLLLLSLLQLTADFCSSTGTHAQLVLETGRAAKDQKLRELALVSLARPGVVAAGRAQRDQIQAEIREWMAAPELRSVQTKVYKAVAREDVDDFTWVLVRMTTSGHLGPLRSRWTLAAGTARSDSWRLSFRRGCSLRCSLSVLRSRNYLFRLRLRLAKSYGSDFSFVGTAPVTVFTAFK
jgi:hypothetical protein